MFVILYVRTSDYDGRMVEGHGGKIRSVNDVRKSMNNQEGRVQVERSN